MNIAPETKTLEFQCCFCNNHSSTSLLDPCSINAVINIDKEENKIYNQFFFCHFECIKNKMVSSASRLLSHIEHTNTQQSTSKNISTFQSIDPKKLYLLIDQYLSGEIKARTFCNQFYNYYEIDDIKNSLNKEEQNVFSHLSSIIYRFTPSETDIAQYPEIYCSEAVLRQETIKTKDRLKLYYNQYNIGHTCCFCEKNIHISNVDPSAINIMTNYDQPDKPYDQHFFCHLNCLKQAMLPTIPLYLESLGDEEAT